MQRDSQPVPLVRRLVLQHPDRPFEVDYDEVEQPVLIEVAHRQAPARCGIREARPRRARLIHEPPAVIVHEELERLPVVRLPVDLLLIVVDMAVRHRQVEPAGVVDVHELRTEPDHHARRLVQPRLLAAVLKRAAPGRCIEAE